MIVIVAAHMARSGKDAYVLRARNGTGKRSRRLPGIKTCYASTLSEGLDEMMKLLRVRVEVREDPELMR